MTEYAALFRLLRDAWGAHKPVRSITRADCRQIRDLVSVLPAHATKRWPGKSLVEVAEHAKANGIALMDPATSNSYFGRLSTMLKWDMREEHVEKNPAVGLQVAEPEGDPRQAAIRSRQTSSAAWSRLCRPTRGSETPGPGYRCSPCSPDAV